MAHPYYEAYTICLLGTFFDDHASVLDGVMSSARGLQQTTVDCPVRLWRDERSLRVNNSPLVLDMNGGSPADLVAYRPANWTW